jgi:hypothetical protein
MKRVLVMALVLCALGACKKQHPVNVYIDPRFSDAKGGQPIEKIAVLEFASSLYHADDPDKIAPRTLEKFFVPALDERKDYNFIAPHTVLYAVEKISSREAYDKFLAAYAATDKPDMAFLAPLAKELQCDGFLIPVVDLWQKDEADKAESSTPATYVGATITVVSPVDGSTLFRATDEDYAEGARTETGDRSLVMDGAGLVNADLGARVHRAPPFEDVAAKVARALAASLPPR